MITIDLKGKLAVVSGGSGEVGREICRGLARAGADVALQYHHGVDRANQVVAELRAMGVRAQAFYADVTDLSSVMELRDHIHDALGDPQIVVDAALILCPPLTVLEQPEEDYISQFESCVMHNVFMAKAFIPAMQACGYGRFIGINTEAAMLCNPNWSAYASAKRGMDGILRVLAKEVGPYGVTVNQIAPGWVATDRFRKTKADPSDYLKNVPLRRMVTDKHISDAVIYLASDLASMVTGVYLPVTGGNIMPSI